MARHGQTNDDDDEHDPNDSPASLLAVPAVLLAQDGKLDRVRAVYPTDAAERIAELVEAARGEGVPADPILDKALEGAAKRVPPDRVLAALSALHDRLRTASELIGPARPDASAVVATSDALRRGVPPETIRRLATDRPDDLTVPMVVLGDLVDAGVPVDQAYVVLQDVLARGAAGDQLLAVPAAVRRLIREGRLPDQAVDAVRSALQKGGLPALGIPVGGVGPPNGPPVPPGAGPPEGKGPPDEKGPPPGKGPPPDGGF